MIPFWVPNFRCRIIIGIQKGTIILTTTHIYIYTPYNGPYIHSPTPPLLLQARSGLGFLAMPYPIYLGTYIRKPPNLFPYLKAYIDLPLLEAYHVHVFFTKQRPKRNACAPQSCVCCIKNGNAVIYVFSRTKRNLNMSEVGRTE